MLNQHLERNSGSKSWSWASGLLALLLAMSACTAQVDPAAQDKDTKDAGGLDAEFGVQTFALSEPTITATSPKDNTTYPIAVGGKLDVEVTYTTANVNGGQVRCHLDGKYLGQGVGGAFKFTGIGKGAHNLTCALANSNGSELTNPASRFSLLVKMAEPCTSGAACDDGNVCSQEACVDSQCVYAMVPTCCYNQYACVVGEVCLNPNTATAKCSSCTSDAECADSESCTTDKCDTSGPKGVCAHIKTDPDCCSKADDPCDDGKSCTVDSCDPIAGKCKHVVPAGVCCKDSDCPADDPCMTGVCVDNECRVGPDKFKPDCCSPALNPTCDDKSSCTIDACDKVMSGGWKACSHTPDPAKPGCCDQNFGNCDDGQPCTADYCENFECKNVELAECCVFSIDCDDQNECTLDKCTLDPDKKKGVCTNDVIAGCCNQNTECADNKFCTVDVCNYAAFKCNFIKTDPECCDSADECSDGNFCTVKDCINHVCVYGKDKFKPGCCDSNADCNDGKPCTIDTCDQAAHQCQFVSNGDPTCCNDASECDDSDCTTFDYCNSFNVCKYTTKPDACKVDIDCDDGIACTADKCETVDGCGKCSHNQLPADQCCQGDLFCDDKNPCTVDTCNAQAKCEHAPAAECCTDDTNAQTACDDNNACTIEYCLNNTCRHTVPKNGCCATSADCDDNNGCTTDTCGNIVGGKGTCQFAAKAGCTAGCDPAKPETYDDGNPCTSDSCALVSGVLKPLNAPVAGCCIDKFDCNDGKPCTFDMCVFNECVYTDSSGGQTLCCSPATENVDCAYLNSPCAVGKCEQQPDASLKCVAVEKPACTVNLSYCQDFEGTQTLKQLGWAPADVVGTAATNWAASTEGGLGPDRFARLSWTPTKSNFLTCLQSPVIQAAGAPAVTIQFDREFAPAFGDSTLTIRGSLDGENVNWSAPSTVLIDGPLTTSDQLGPDTLTVKLPPELSNSNGLRLAFCVGSASSLNLDQFAVDNVCIVKGDAPKIKACPANQNVKLGTVTTIPLKVTDPDAADIISFQLVKAPSFVKLSSSLFYWLDSTWNSTLTIAPKSLADIGEHEVTIKYTDGFLYGTCTLKVQVTYEGGYLIWSPLPDSGVVPTHASAKAIQAALSAKGQFGQIATDLSIYPNLGKFKAVFVTLGVYPDNHMVVESEVNSLKAYLSAGGKVYMEGGDTFLFDPPTTLHPFFKIKGVLDYPAAGITGPLKSYAAFSDNTQNPPISYSWAYSDQTDYNNLNDEIEGQTSIAKTKNLLRNEGDEKYWVAVGHDNPVANYRTIGASVLFGGVQTSGASSKDALMTRILWFFDNGFVDCTKNSDCDDGNACTTDTCAAGACTNENTCICGAQSSINCGGTLTKVVTNGGDSTQATHAYSCDPGNLYLGKEVAYAYKPTSSKPATVTLSNVSNPKARIFVLKATDKGCDPTSCVATGAANAPLTFASFLNTQYYIVVDVPDANDSAQFDLALTCAAGEDCANGKDDNANGLVDCLDKTSCCGDNACQAELCNGLDDNCDGNIDEGCDDDGDGWCDVAATVVGKPAICSAGVGDCNDTDGTVNPAQPEICNNGKDDNCSGAQNEDNANGCVNYFSDLDGDAFGTGAAKCMCAPSGTFKATKNNDCNDAQPKINPGVQEDCASLDDDNCNGSTNDTDAIGCKNFYTDVDGDLFGTTPFKCMCVGAGLITAAKPGDCADTNASINPSIAELCNNVDDNCNGLTDDGCDDDKDGYCDTDLQFLPPSNDPLGVCPKGAGDTDDTDPEINPEGKEICDSKDNNSDGQTDEGCDDDKDGYCDSAMVTIGKPKSCPFGGGDCDDLSVALNPGVPEDCKTEVDDNCNGGNNDLNAVDCTPYFFDADTDKWGTTSAKCLCQPIGQYNAINPGDCNDDDKLINPAAKEICDDVDNDCNKEVDDTCDDDGDGYCDAGVLQVGTPAICLNGGGDCVDIDAQVNPGKAEICGDGKDNNCNGSQNDAGAIGCIPFYTDGDKDSYGAGVKKCLCEGAGVYTSTNDADCNDSKDAINPAVPEACNNIDDNCDGLVDEGCDDDQDGVCDAAMGFAGNPEICPQGGGDCDDTNATVYKGKQAEVCDGLDDDCNGKADNGCDDDKDSFCDAGYEVAFPPPDSCVKGGGDCDDFDNTVNPGAKEVCANNKDDNCNGSQNDENAVGCTTLYYDDDADGFGNSIGKCLCEAVGSFNQTKSGDCDDGNPQISPAITEFCNGTDDDCDGTVDEADATGCQTFYYDEDKDGFGLDLTQCLCAPTTPYVSTQKGDCDDTNAQMKPGFAEICDNLDNDCDTQVDEGCNADGDQFCTAQMQTIGVPNVCPLGGGDCDDTDKTVSPVGNEVCNAKDDNCNGVTDEGCDDDKDGYCDANLTTVGTPASCPKGGGDCNDNVLAINPGAKEVCGNTVDENCSGGYNDENATGCSIFYVDFDGDNQGKGGSSFQKVILNEVRRNTNGLTGPTGNEYLEFLIGSDVTTAEFDGWYIGDSTGTGAAKFGVIQTKLASLGITTLKAGSLVTIGGPGIITQDLTYNPAGGDWNLTLDSTGAYVTTVAAGFDLTAADVVWIDTSATGETSLDSLRYSSAIGALGAAAKTQVALSPSDGLTGVIAFTGGITDVNKPASYSLDVGGTPGQANGGANGTLVSWLRSVSLKGDSRCQCTADDTYKVSKPGDCNDANNLVFSGAVELCDGVDNNCNSVIDEGCDADGDGYCDVAKLTVGTPPGCPFGGGDCNDTNKLINPGAVENCSDGVDTNCDGILNSPGGVGCVDYFYDGDKDGYGADVKQCLCGPSGAYTAAKGGDCDDTLGNVKPDSAEDCSTPVDDNCDGLTNGIDALNCVNYYNDTDKDGYGLGGPVCQCIPSGAVIASVAGDCDDADGMVNPGQAEICDAKDNNCNGAGVSSGAESNAATGVPISLDGYVAQEVVFATAGKFDKIEVSIAAASVGETVTMYLYKTALPAALGIAQIEAIGPVTLTATQMTKYAFQSKLFPAVSAGEKWVMVWKASGIGSTLQGSSANAYAKGGSSAAAATPFAWSALGSGSTDVTFKAFMLIAGDSIDEGCNDDGDGYCDGNMETAKVPPQICPKGGADCNDANQNVNKDAAEACDDIDNDCDGLTDEGCDADGDGWCSAAMTVVGSPAVCKQGKDDCDDTNKLVFPGKVELCDDIDNNCSGAVDEGCDADGDDYCTALMATVGAPAACPKGGFDCADSDATVNPGVAEICDGKDNNCAAGIDEICVDNDKDGYCNGAAPISPGCPKGGNDCDDTLASVNPGATEDCSTLNDDNCNGITNEVGAANCSDWYADNDNDGFGGGVAACQCYQTPGKPTKVGGDCVDSDAAVNPLAVELCDGKDNDCAAGADNGCDDDSDGFCDAQRVMTATALCGNSPKPVVGQTKAGDDCNDDQASVRPNAPELCDNLDNDCTGIIDDGCDDDNDNYCEAGKTLVGIPPTCTAGGGDCNDNSAAVNPAPTTQESCATPFDDNCDGSADALGAAACKNFYFDGDGDGYGTFAFECRCAANGKYSAPVSGDCNDSDPTLASSSAPETCDGLDNNCNGTTDEGCDVDKDGYCNAALSVTNNIACPKTVIGPAKMGNDCDDLNNKVNPGQIEICDGVDNNCVAGIDELCDKDLDGFCDAAKPTVGLPNICKNGGGDCDDNNASVKPSSPEICDGKDNNCNLLVDEAGSVGCTQFYFDGDQDGFGVNSTQCLCGKSGLFSANNNTDCNDNCPTCAPGKPEQCDGADNNCNSAVDEGCNADGDGYCTAAMVTVGTPPVCTKGGGDCNDGNATVYPASPEKCNNIDDNCNGTTDEQAADQCPQNLNATFKCEAGQCKIDKCADWHADLNGSWTDGCECNGYDTYEPNNTCGEATLLSNALYDNNKPISVEARVVQSTDVDWWKVYAADLGDGGYAACDQFNLRVLFTKQPGGLAFDVWKDYCPSGTSPNNVCCNSTDFNWFTNFKGRQNSEPSRQWSEWGECPCQTGNQFDRSNYGWDRHVSNGGPYCKDINNGYVCVPTGYHFTSCDDNSSWFYIRVYRPGGSPTCGNYKLEISNATYGQPGTGNGYQP